MGKYIVSMSAGVSYTLTGDQKNASFSPPSDTVTDVYRVDGSQSAAIKFNGPVRTINITRARIRAAGLSVVANSALAAKVELNLCRVENGAVIGNRIGRVVLSFDRYDEYEAKDAVIVLPVKEVENLGIVIGSSTVFNIFDFDVQDVLIGESVTPIIDLEISTEMGVIYE